MLADLSGGINTISLRMVIMDNRPEMEQTTDLTFSIALQRVKRGKAIQRSGWNGKGLLVKAQFPDENSKMNLPYLYIEYPDGKKCPWVASQTDIMSEDWSVVE